MSSNTPTLYYFPYYERERIPWNERQFCFKDIYIYIYFIYIYIYRSDEGLTLETSAFLPFTVANLRFQPSC